MSDTPDFKQLMNMAQQMQKNMEEIQEGLNTKRVTGVAGTGDISVEVTVNGHQYFEKVVIGDGVIAEGKEVLADLFAAAANNAIDKVKEMTKKAMVDVYEKSGIEGGKE